MLDESTNTVTFADVAGCDEAKEEVKEVVDFLKDPAKFQKLGGRIPRGLLLVGPPGTGKTSLGAAIANSIGREFYRISVGGVRDEAEIRGHRRTYVGAMPGLLIQALRRVEVRDPVIMIDEIDKMSNDGSSGDPTAAMLEVLDPSQNTSFVDHYLNLPFDLSSVLFICTANNLYDIPGPLRDRMEVIRIAGYTIEEKIEIAQRYLMPRLLEDHGLTADDLRVPEATLAFITSRYSREAGLRTFERSLASLLRKRARAKADGYTLLAGSSTTLAANVGLYKSLPYDPIKSFVPITKLVDSAYVLLVNPKLPTGEIEVYATGLTVLGEAAELHRAEGSVAEWRGVPPVECRAFHPRRVDAFVCLSWSHGWFWKNWVSTSSRCE